MTPHEFRMQNAATLISARNETATWPYTAHDGTRRPVEHARTMLDCVTVDGTGKLSIAGDEYGWTWTGDVHTDIIGYRTTHLTHGVQIPGTITGAHIHSDPRPSKGLHFKYEPEEPVYYENRADYLRSRHIHATRASAFNTFGPYEAHKYSDGSLEIIDTRNGASIHHRDTTFDALCITAARYATRGAPFLSRTMDEPVMSAPLDLPQTIRKSLLQQLLQWFNRVYHPNPTGDTMSSSRHTLAAAMARHAPVTSLDVQYENPAHPGGSVLINGDAMYQGPITDADKLNIAVARSCGVTITDDYDAAS